MSLVDAHTKDALHGFTPALVIFDKDGTLIDFDSMWGGWVEALAQRLQGLAGQGASARIDECLYRTMGYDAGMGRVQPDGPLAVWTMGRLRDLTVDVLRQLNIPSRAAENAVSEAWHAPDPVAGARPCADLPALFRALRARGAKIAVATTDDREPTQSTLAGLGVAELVDALACGDDGVPVKPAPDLVWAVCKATGVAPDRAMVVGDSVADMKMGRAAGAGQVVGVLTGLGTAEMLSAHTDVLLQSIAELV